MPGQASPYISVWNVKIRLQCGGQYYNIANLFTFFTQQALVFFPLRMVRARKTVLLKNWLAAALRTVHTYIRPLAATNQGLIKLQPMASGALAIEEGPYLREQQHTVPSPRGLGPSNQVTPVYDLAHVRYYTAIFARCMYVSNACRLLLHILLRFPA
jgi:hypothetical protein